MNDDNLSRRAAIMIDRETLHARQMRRAAPKKLRVRHLPARANPRSSPFGLAWRAATEQNRLWKPASGESRIGRLEQRRAYHGVAHFADPARAVDLAGLVLLRCQPDVGADRLRLGEPLGLVDGRPEGHSHHRAHARDGHQATTHSVLANRPEKVAMQRGIFGTQCGSGPKQRLGDPLEHNLASHELADAGFKLAFAHRTDLESEAA